MMTQFAVERPAVMANIRVGRKDRLKLIGAHDQTTSSSSKTAET